MSFSSEYRPNLYILDGRGITYDYKIVKPGTQVCLDDDLVLWVTKKLTRATR